MSEFKDSYQIFNDTSIGERKAYLNQSVIPVKHPGYYRLFSWVMTIFFFISGILGAAWWLKRSHTTDLLERSLTLSQIIKSSKSLSLEKNLVDRKITDFQLGDKHLAYLLIWNSEKKFFYARTFTGNGELQNYVNTLMRPLEKGSRFQKNKKLMAFLKKTPFQLQIFITRIKEQDINGNDFFLEVGHIFTPWEKYAMELPFFLIGWLVFSMFFLIILRKIMQIVAADSSIEKTLNKRKFISKALPNIRKNHQPEERFQQVQSKNAPGSNMEEKTEHFSPFPFDFSKEGIIQPGLVFSKGQFEQPLIRKLEALELVNDNFRDHQVIFTDNFSYKLGRGKERVRVKKVDLEKLKSLQIIQCDNINFTLEMMHEDFNNFEKKIREKSSFDDVSKDIILKLNHYFPGHEINIFLRDSKSGELIRAIGFSQGQWQNLKDVASSQNQTYFENNQALNDKIRTSEKSFFEQEQLLLWCPLVCNRVFMGAILFQNDEGKVIEAELKGKIDFLLQSISLTFFHFKLYEMILTDSLTSLYNKRYLNRRLAEFIEQYKGSDIEATLAIVDIDFFKRINDNYGHNAGDEALKTISEKIRNNISQNAEAFRYGGEEFVILFTNLGPREVLASCERLRSEIMNIAFQYEEKKIPLTVSIGLAHFHKAIISEEEWFNQGDKALYRAKETGRNQSVVFQEEVFPNVSYFEQSKIQIHGAENLQPA